MIKATTCGPGLPDISRKSRVCCHTQSARCRAGNFLAAGSNPLRPQERSKIVRLTIDVAVVGRYMLASLALWADADARIFATLREYLSQFDPFNARTAGQDPEVVLQNRRDGLARHRRTQRILRAVTVIAGSQPPVLGGHNAFLLKGGHEMLENLPETVGEALQHQRAGLEGTIIHRLANRAQWVQIEVHSSAFNAQRSIPLKYTADGAGLSPPLDWRGVPTSASHVVVVVEDADSPTPNPLVHAIVVLNDLRESSLVEGALNSPDHAGYGLQTGRNSFLSQAWLPPDPPPGHGVHRYVFQVFALRDAHLSDVPGRHEVVRALESRGLAGGYCVGTFGRGARVHEDEPVVAASVDADAVPA